MDMHCVGCGEPYEGYYLRHELPHELPPEIQNIYTEYGLTPAVRAEFKTLGFVFGPHILALLRCDCCPDDINEADPAIKARSNLACEAAELLGDDLDAYEVEFPELYF